MDNRTFWNERYLSLPALGSGPGSRAYAAWVKRRLMEATIAEHGVRSILDIGCGDMHWFAEVPLTGVAYTGVDISDVIVDENRRKLPQLEFVLHDIAAAPLARSADLVVCFDVLIHQLALEQFRSTLRNVLSSVSAMALITYSTADASRGTQDADAPAGVRRDEEALLQFLDRAAFPRAETAFHGALPEHVRAILPEANVRVAGRYPFQTIYEIKR